MRSSRMMRPKEVSEYTQLPIASLAKMRMRGDGPHFYKVSRLVIYDVDDIEVWLEARKRRSTRD